MELPNGVGKHDDYAITITRNFLAGALHKLLWQTLTQSSDPELAAIAARATKEAGAHWRHASEWMVRLGDGTEESRARCGVALATLWRYVPEFFVADAVDEQAQTTGLGPSWHVLEASWREEMDAILSAAELQVPEASKFLSTGKQGVHSEHMGYLLAEMQYLQRAYPGGAW